MILILSAIGVILLGFVLLGIHHAQDRGSYSGWELLHQSFLTTGVLLLVIMLLAVVMREPCAGAHVEKFEAVQLTMDNARLNENISPLELAAIQQKAVEKNESLASLKFWAKHPLTNWFYSKKVLAIRPIK